MTQYCHVVGEQCGPTDLGKGEVEWEVGLALLVPASPWKPSLHQASSKGAD